MANDGPLSRSISCYTELLDVLNDLGPDELEVVLGIAQGIHRGREVYGEYQMLTDNRKAGVEAWQEIRDGLVYTQMQINKLLAAKNE